MFRCIWYKIHSKSPDPSMAQFYSIEALEQYPVVVEDWAMIYLHFPGEFVSSKVGKQSLVCYTTY
jgi:hypothetical protein